MPADANQAVVSDLAGLHSISCELHRADASHRRALVTRFLTHPICREKLRSACGIAMKSWARRRDLVADVCQEATCDVTERLLTGTLDCPHSAADAFGGWLWRVWFNACRRAWRGYFRQLRQSIPLHLADQTTDPERDSRRADQWSLILQAISLLPDPTLQGVMTDWSHGLNGSESSGRRGLACSTICRYRRQGVRLIRDWCAVHAGDE